MNILNEDGTYLLHPGHLRMIWLRRQVEILLPPVVAYPARIHPPCNEFHDNKHLNRPGWPLQFQGHHLTHMIVCTQCARQVQEILIDITLVFHGILCLSVGPLLSGAVRGRHTSAWHISWPPMTCRGGASSPTDAHLQKQKSS